MNWRWYLGSSLNAVIQSTLSNRYFPLLRSLPCGLSEFYDIQRFSRSKKQPVLFDAGANIGQTAALMRRYFPDSDIYCFEPVKSTFDTLCKRFSGKARFHLEQLALGNETKSTPILIFENSEMNTLTSEGSSIESSTGSELIRVTTLDSYCADQQISSIDLLKMDVQGWELKVLEGAEKMIQEGRIHFIYAEVGFRRHDKDIQYFEDLNSYLTGRGFFLSGFYTPLRWGAQKEFLGFTNALYINRGFGNGSVHN